MTTPFRNIPRPSEEEWMRMTQSEKRAELIRRRPAYETKLEEIFTAYGIKFDIQVPIGCYFADFQLIPHKLIVEVDGLYHNDITQKLLDIRRSEFLKKNGFSIIRVTNDQIQHRQVDVCLAIKRVIEGKVRKRRR